MEVEWAGHQQSQSLVRSYGEGDKETAVLKSRGEHTLEKNGRLLRLNVKGSMVLEVSVSISLLEIRGMLSA